MNLVPDLRKLDERAIGETIDNILCVGGRQHAPAGLIARQHQSRAFNARPDRGKIKSLSPAAFEDRRTDRGIKIAQPAGAESNRRAVADVAQPQRTGAALVSQNDVGLLARDGAHVAGAAGQLLHGHKQRSVGGFVQAFQKSW